MFVSIAGQGRVCLASKNGKFLKNLLRICDLKVNVTYIFRISPLIFRGIHATKINFDCTVDLVTFR